MRKSSLRRYGMLNLLLLVVLLLVACGGAATPANPTTVPEAEQTDPTEAPAEVEPTEAMEPTEAPVEATEEPTPSESAPEGEATATEEMMEPTEEPEATAEPETTEEPAGGEMMLPEVDPAAVEGDIIIAGSSTVYPLTQAIADRFTDEGYAGQITIDEVGTGGGFERFCVNAETDIANASREIDEEETAACEAAGRTPTAFRVGTDALAIVVSADNDFVDELTLEQLGQIFSGEATTWDQVDASFPAEAIELYSPGSDSGTYDYFVEEVLEDDPAGLDASGAQFSEDDNVLVQGVQASPNAIGYFGYAYYLENADTLKILNIDGVEATADTAESNDYPLSRPLYIYSAPEVMAEKPQVAEFVSFYLQFVNEEIEEVGYFPASDEALGEAQQTLMGAMGMEGAMEEDGEEGGMTEPTVVLPEVDPAAVEGDIIIAGSSTVYPLTQAIADRFTDEGYAGQITIDEVGTGGGFERFCVNAETDIANASREIDEEETAACEAAGRTPTAFRVGTDALAIVVSADNDFVDELTLEQLGQIFSGEATTWDQVDASFPAEAIELYSPGSDSGTYDYFVEEVLEDDPAGLDASGAQFSEDDNVLVQGVQASPNAIGYFGYAYYLENADTLKILNIDGVEPTAETAENGDYPLSRPLYIYSAPEVMAEKPYVTEFVSFYLQFVNEEIEEVGYFPASGAALDEARNTILDVLGQ